MEYPKLTQTAQRESILTFASLVRLVPPSSNPSLLQHTNSTLSSPSQNSRVYHYSSCVLLCLLSRPLRLPADMFAFARLLAQLGNKNDLPTALSVEDLIAQLKLAKITNRPVSVSLHPPALGKRCGLTRR
jgi:hypothetical protein